MQLDQAQLLRIALQVGAAIGVLLLGRWLAHRVRKSLGATLSKSTIGPSMARLIILGANYGIRLVSLIVARHCLASR